MCGISGIIYHNPRHYCNLGSTLLALSQPLSSRGFDSCGVALYGVNTNASQVKILLRGNGNVQWQEVKHWISQTAPVISTEAIADGQRLILDLSNCEQLDLNILRQQLRQKFSGLHCMSAGQSLEIYKEVGAIANLDKTYSLRDFFGSHGIGHTRMATESAVDMERSHPFTTGCDLAIVHNGQISNYYRLRFQLEQSGIVFETDNDSELLVHYIHQSLQQGKSLEATLHKLIDDVDGSYTFLVSTLREVGLVRDKFASKPAVIYQSGEVVAIASEYRALLNLPFDRNATIREPDAGEVNVWSTAAVRELQPTSLGR